MKQLIFLFLLVLLGCGSPKNNANNSKGRNMANPDSRLLDNSDSIKPFSDTLTTRKDFALHNKEQDISIDFISVPDYIEFEGSIESKGKINLVLYTDYDKAYGKYYYYSDPTSIIPFKGYCGVGWDFADVELIEYNKSGNIDAISNNTPRATLKGVIKNKVFSGEYKDLKNGNILPFKLYQKNLKKELSYRRYYLETKIKDDVFINDFKTDLAYQCSPNIDTLFWQRLSDDNYILLFVSHYTKCAAYDHGNCGAGMERFIIYQHLNSKTNLQMQQIIQFESCISNRNGSIGIDNNVYNGNNDDMIKQFNFNEFKSLKLTFDSTTYMLNKTNLNAGFILTKPDKKTRQ